MMTEKNEQLEEDFLEEKSDLELTSTEESNEETMEDLDVYQDNFPKEKKVKRHTRAVKMVSEAKRLASEAEEEMHSGTLLLESNLDAYEKAKDELYRNGLSACISALKKVGVNVEEDVQRAKNCTVYEAHEDVTAMHIKGVSRSKFASFIFAIVVALLASVGFLYVATQALAMPLDFTQIPSQANIERVMTYFSSWVQMESLPLGIAIYGVSVFLVGYVAYLLRIFYKANANLHFAAKQLAEAELYKEIKQDGKYKLDQVDTQVKESIALFEKCAVFCNEQQGTLHRIAYIEGEKENITDYNRRSNREIKRTQMLVEHILAFLSVPLSKDNKLSEESVTLLGATHNHLDKLIERLYRVRREDEEK